MLVEKIQINVALVGEYDATVTSNDVPGLRFQCTFHSHRTLQDAIKAEIKLLRPDLEYRAVEMMYAAMTFDFFMEKIP